MTITKHLSNRSAFVISASLVFLILLPQFVAAGTTMPVKHIKHLFSIKGSESDPLSLPSDVSVDENGDIYVVDSGNNRVAVFDRKGRAVLTIPAKVNKQSKLNNPVGIYTDSYNLYVADKDNHRIKIFSKDGLFRKSVLVKQGGELIRPVDVAYNKKLNIFYISGNNNHKVMAYDYSGKFLFNWGGEGANKGEFRYPATISLSHDNVYVVDVLNSRVQVFNNRGKLQTIAGEWGVLPGQLFRPKGVALDKQGNIYVSDSYLGVIQVFFSDTRLRYVLADNDKPYRFTSPSGIAVDNNNRLYVCEMLENRVSVFSLGL